MPARNDITDDLIKTGPITDPETSDKFDRIFKHGKYAAPAPDCDTRCKFAPQPPSCETPTRDKDPANGQK